MDPYLNIKMAETIASRASNPFRINVATMEPYSIADILEIHVKDPSKRLNLSEIEGMSWFPDADKFEVFIISLGRRACLEALAIGPECIPKEWIGSQVPVIVPIKSISDAYMHREGVDAQNSYFTDPCCIAAKMTCRRLIGIVD